MAFLLVQRLDPTHKSLLTELLAAFTAMVVKEAEHDEASIPNVVYVIPPDAALGVRMGRIELSELKTQRGARLSVDHLFRSLARDFGAKACGIIFSGAGGDGSVGLRDIKAAGGLVIVQDPSTCTQAGMPQHAIATGAVDLVLPIAAMPEALERFLRLPPVEPEAVEALEANNEPANATATSGEQKGLDPDALRRLAAILEANAGFDHDALAMARTGIYAPDIAERVPPEYLRRYFTPLTARGYQVQPQLRDVVSFASHDITKEPPFSRMDLVSCRNVLIYLRTQAQQGAVPQAWRADR